MTGAQAAMIPRLISILSTNEPSCKVAGKEDGVGKTKVRRNHTFLLVHWEFQPLQIIEISVLEDL